MVEYFADTYALVEFCRGNKSYKKHILENRIITTKLNLMELYYATLVDGNAALAEGYYESFLPNVVEISDDSIKEAMKLKYSQREKKLSYTDAIGYQLSLERGIRFLTGDRQFKEMKNVEFVK